MRKFELEKVITTGHLEDGYRTEEHIAFSECRQELIQMAAKLPLKGGRYRAEWFSILELDENGDIIDYFYTMFADDPRRRTGK